MVRAPENCLPSSVRAERSSNDVTLIENQGSSDTSAEAHSIGSMLFGMEICRILDVYMGARCTFLVPPPHPHGMVPPHTPQY